MKLTKREKKALESCYTILSLLYYNNKIPKKLKIDGINLKLNGDKLHDDLLVLNNLQVRLYKLENEKLIYKEKLGD